MVKFILFIITLIPFFLMAQEADIALMNGLIYTVDQNRPRAEALAVSQGRIVAVGSKAEIQRFIGTKTKVIDLKGKLVLPGFIDNHVHFMSGALQLRNVDLRNAKSEKEFADIIRKRAVQKPGKWITGGDWDHDNWQSAAVPVKKLIDEFTSATPVFVSRYDGHMALANSYALSLAGVTRDTPDPVGGVIVRDPADGEPTGLLKDEAMSLVYRVIPDDLEEERLEVARLALREAAKFGVTTVHDVSSGNDMRTYRTLKNKGELTLRFHCRLPMSQYQHLAASGIEIPFGDDMIKIGSLKAFADGSLGSSTALFFDPYVSDPTTRGVAMDILVDGRLEEWSIAADKNKLQLSVHAIGDSANSRVLDIFEKILKNNPAWDRRFRIEHAQHIDPKDFSRFAQLGVIASVQPYHAVDDGRWAHKRIGKERCKDTYPFRSFIDNNVILSFGSDWTVAPINPLLGIYAAVTRRTGDGLNPDGWIPEQKITVEEAIACYTVNNAFAAFEENEKGSISLGKFADMVVLSENILTIDPRKIQDVKVEKTIVGGKIIFER